MANPLLDSRRQLSPGIGKHNQPTDIDGYCDWLNRSGASAKQGWRWTIAAAEDGRRYIDRRDAPEPRHERDRPVAPVRHWSETDAA